MSRKSQTTRMVTTVVLAVMLGVWGIVGFTDAASAKKPPKDPPGGSDYLYAAEPLGMAGSAISDFGQVAGYAQIPLSDPKRSEMHALLLTPEDTDGNGVPDTWFRDDERDGINDLLIDLGILGVTTYPDDPETPEDEERFIGSCHATAINELGQVVGTSTIDSEATAKRHGFFWEDANGNGSSDEGEMVDLGTLGGHRNMSEAACLNNFGEVVGWADSPLNNPAGNSLQRAFIIVPEDTDGDGIRDTWYRDDNGDGANDLMTDLGTLGGLYSYANFINDAGQVLGMADGSNPDYWGRHIARAFLITPEDADGDGVPDTWFRDVNDDGANDLMTDLGTLGGPGSSASAMNDSGQIAGVAEIREDSSRAFLLTPEDTDGDGAPDTWFRDVNGDGANDLMENLGTMPARKESAARDLNNAGQVIGKSWTLKGGHGATSYGWEVDSFFWQGGQMENLEEITEGEAGSDPVGINNAGQIVAGYHILLPIESNP